MAARSNTLSADLPEPGMVLGRAYTIVEAIDGGPSGDCLRATDKRLDRAVLVTVMRAEHASSPIR